MKETASTFMDMERIGMDVERTGADARGDYAAPWFRARAAAGVDDTIFFGVIDPERRDVNWHRLRHRDADGIGGFLHLFRRWGVVRYALPSQRVESVPSLYRSWAAARQVPPESPPAWQWRTLDRSPDTQGGEPVSVRWFSREQTQALKSAAVAQGVSLATLAFCVLHDTVMTQLAEGEGGSWFYPVSLRGALQLGSDTRNHSSGFYLSLPRAIDAATLQQRLRTRLRAGQHWWLWHQARLSCRLGQPAVNFLYRRMLHRQHHLGSFSTLGEWWMSTRGSSLPAGALLCVCGPGSPNHPVANGMMIINGQLTLSLRLDAAIRAGDRARERCLDDWCAGLLAQCRLPSEKGRGHD